MSDSERQNFAARGQAAEHPGIVLHGGALFFEGQHGWARLLDPNRNLNRADVAEIDAQLRRAELDRQQRAAGRLPEPTPADPNAPPTFDEERTQQLIEESRREAEFRATDSGRLQTIIELLERQNELLERAGQR